MISYQSLQPFQTRIFILVSKHEYREPEKFIETVGGLFDEVKRFAHSLWIGFCNFYGIFSLLKILMLLLNVKV